MKFLKEAQRDIKTVGAVSPSSKFLVNKMVKPVDFANSKTLVEFGAGTGVVTRAILKNMNPDTQLLAYEINSTFYGRLEKIDDERLLLQKDSVENLWSLMEERQIKEVDYILSSLPLSLFPKEQVSQILDVSRRALKKDGKYIQFQYSLNNLKDMRKYFERVKLDFSLLNMPPTFVYNCLKKNEE